MKPPAFLRAWDGLGDSIYLRPFVRALASRRELYLATPWPELFEDLPVKFVRPKTPLRTQRKNELRQPDDRWVELPPGTKKIRPYILADGRSVPKGIADRIPLRGRPFIFDLPDFGPSPITSEKPIAVIRPVTVRGEWRNEARNPGPEHVYEAGWGMTLDGFHIVSVADLRKGEEWMLSPVPPAHQAFHQGELGIKDLVSLIRHAAIVVGGVGFILPMAIATRTPAIIIAGGNGAHNNPKRLIGMGMDDSKVRWIFPDNFCMCDRNDHGCDKRISDFDEKFSAALQELQV